jgi:REP element-mobilizing transposase RayT
MRELLGIPPRNCQTAVKTGMLKIVQDKHIHLIITGPDGDSVLDAMKVLTDERHRTQLKVQNASVVRRLYRKYYLIGGGRFLDIGQTIGAETPTLYTGYPYVTYKPFDEYRGTTYGAIVTTSTSRQRAYFPTTSGA